MLEPFLKWPGGKRWLVHQHANFFPPSYRRYLEPFLGGAAVFFHLQPARAILSDTNAELINAYRCLRQHWELIDEQLRTLQKGHSIELYYRIRGLRPIDPLERAVRFIYLNRTCFNGIYRVNKNGDFNVPIGSKDGVEYPEGYLKTIADSLATASLKVAGFENTINTADKGDFVFVDPPYTVRHNNNNFLKYNSSLFSWSDQVKLAVAIKAAAERGAEIMLSNADHSSVRELYRGFGNHRHIKRASILAADASHRGKTTELLITTYTPGNTR
jgi:DNA adenine methylase